MQHDSRDEGRKREVNALRLWVPERNPNDENPWGDDLLGRTNYRDALQEAVEAFAGKGASILLDGGYGTGKSFILDRWAHSLRNQGIPVRQYNAWEHDGDEDPLVSLVEVLTEQDVEAPIDLAAAAGDLLLQVPKILVGIDLQRTLESGLDAYTADFAAAVRGRRQASNVLRKGLSKWAKKSGCGYAVVIVDELDRCRPSFALRVLERVKHVLNTLGLAFVFGASRQALANAFLHEHGAGADAEGYLLRMFDCPLALPPGVLFADDDERGKYIEALAKAHDLADKSRALPMGKQANRDYWGGELRPMLTFLAGGGQMTPRELERLVQGLATAVTMATSRNQKQHVLQPFVLLPMLAAKLKRPEAYERMISKPNSGADVVDCLADLMGEMRPAPDQDKIRHVLDEVEKTIYLACRANSDAPSPITVLEAIRDGKDVSPNDEKLLASRRRGQGRDDAEEMMTHIDRWRQDTGENWRLKFSMVRMWTERLNMIRMR